MKAALLDFEIKLVLLQALEDLCNVLTVFLQILGVYEYVINVYKHKFGKKVSEHSMHEIWIDWTL